MLPATHFRSRGRKLMLVFEHRLGDLRSMTIEIAQQYLADRAALVSQKTLDLDRQAMQMHLGVRLEVVKSERETHLSTRSYTTAQVGRIACLEIARPQLPVFRQAFAGAGGASFWLFTGDLTDDPDDGLWQEWFDAAGFIPRMIPSIMSPGNHDHASVTVDGKKERTQELPLWRPQFTLPENGVAGLEELSYVVDYQGVRFLMLNSNDELERQAAWADSVLARNPNHWTVAAFHHPFYSSGRTRDGKTTRVAFQEVFERRGVDLVLQGHDHTYARSKKLLGGKVVGARDRGIVYVVSSCGPKTYVLQPLYRELMATMGENQQLYQVVSVANNTLQYKAMTAIGTLFDAFELTK